MARGNNRAAVMVADSAGEPILEGGPSLLDGVAVELEAAGPDTVDGAEITETADGGVVVDLAPRLGNAIVDVSKHDANLADVMTSSDVSSLGSELLAAVEDDNRSRADWYYMLTQGLNLLGLKLEERTTPFNGASGVFDPIMAEAVIRWQATATGELLPAAGPVKTKIYGSVTSALEKQGMRVKDFMNLYLTSLAPEYYDEFDRMLFWLPFAGSTFKKVYHDPILRRPVSRFVTPDKFITAYGTTDLESCPRYTHVTEVSEKTLKQYQAKGLWRNVDIGDGIRTGDSRSDVTKAVDDALGFRPVLARNDRMYDIYEVHADLVLPGTFDEGVGIPLPYIVTIEKQTQQVLSIRRNWKEGDLDQRKRLSFVHYCFIPGLGFYGIGYAHILGASAKGSTDARRQLLDAGTLNNFPGGLRVKGMKFADNNLSIGPMEFPEVDTGGLPIQNAIMNMPYKEPSVVLLELMKETNEGARTLANTSEIAIGEGRQDAPVGTTVALIEAATKVQTATIKRAHRSAAKEFKLIADIFGETLPVKEKYPFPVPGGDQAIMREDFADNIDVIPVSDPNVTSGPQRLMLAEAALQKAAIAPSLYDQYWAHRNYLEALNMDTDRIDKMLPAPQDAQPLDPLSENMNALQGKPLRAGIEQDHDSHITAHMAVAQQSPSMQAHVAEHLALKMRVAVEAITGPLPPPGTKLPPEIENQIARGVAAAIQQIEAKKREENGGLPDDPAMAMVVTEKQKNEQNAGIKQAELAFKEHKLQVDSANEAADRANDREIEIIRQQGDVAQRQATPSPAQDSAIKRSST